MYNPHLASSSGAPVSTLARIRIKAEYPLDPLASRWKVSSAASHVLIHFSVHEITLVFFLRLLLGSAQARPNGTIDRLKK
jgi:hypothetical protein